MNKVFLIEKAPDVFSSVKNYLSENDIPYVAFSTVNAALLSQETPSLVVHFTLPDYRELKRDMTAIKTSPLIARTPKILILPFEEAAFSPDTDALDIQFAFRTPVDKHQFLSAVSILTKRSPRRVFRILVSVQAEGSNIRFSGLSIDFSESGMAFECSAEFRPGQRVGIQFVNPRTRKRFTLKGEVVRQVTSPTGGASFYGVMFADLTSEDLSSLMSFIAGG